MSGLAPLTSFLCDEERQSLLLWHSLIKCVANAETISKEVRDKHLRKLFAHAWAEANAVSDPLYEFDAIRASFNAAFASVYGMNQRYGSNDPFDYPETVARVYVEANNLFAAVSATVADLPYGYARINALKLVNASRDSLAKAGCLVGSLDAVTLTRAVQSMEYAVAYAQEAYFYVTDPTRMLELDDAEEKACVAAYQAKNAAAMYAKIANIGPVYMERALESAAEAAATWSAYQAAEAARDVFKATRMIKVWVDERAASAAPSSQ